MSGPVAQAFEELAEKLRRLRRRMRELHPELELTEKEQEAVLRYMFWEAPAGIRRVHLPAFARLYRAGWRPRHGRWDPLAEGEEAPA